jgi:hypothetical protein
MEVHVDPSWILQVAEMAGAGDPAADDYGVPIAACARHQGQLLEHPVYGGPYARAGALVHTLGRCRWLERSNLAVAAAAGVMYLEASGISVKPAQEDAAALTNLLLDNRSTAQAVATLLKSWPATGAVS